MTNNNMNSIETNSNMVSIDTNIIQSSSDSKMIKVSSAMIVAGIDDNRFLLLGIRNKDGKLSLPCGHQKPSESSRECAARELFEESNITVKQESLIELRKESYEKDGHVCMISCFCTEMVDMPKCDSSKDPDLEFSGIFWTPIIEGKIDPKLIQHFTDSQKKTIQLVSCVPGVKKQLMSTNPVVKIDGLWLKKSKQSTGNVDYWHILKKSDKTSENGLIRVEKKKNKEKEIADSVKYSQAPVFDTHDVTNVKAGKWLNTDSMSSLLLALSTHYKNISVEGKPTGSKHTLAKSVSSNSVRTPGQVISTKNMYLVLQKSTPTESLEIKSNWHIYMKSGEKAGEVDSLHKKGLNNIALVYKDFKIPDKVTMVNSDPEQGDDNNIKSTFKKFGVKEHTAEVTKGLMHWYIKSDADFVSAANQKKEKLEKCLKYFPASKTEKMRSTLNSLKDALKEMNELKDNEGKENIFADLKPMSAIASFKQRWWHIITSEINAGARDKKINITADEAKDYENDRKKLIECCGDVLPKEILPPPVEFMANIIDKGGK